MAIDSSKYVMMRVYSSTVCYCVAFMVVLPGAVAISFEMDSAGKVEATPKEATATNARIL